MNPLLIEVCAAHVQSALEAQKGGAKRVELCDNLYEGGTTPSYAAIRLAREKLNIGLNIMIRPRGGDFCYSDLEFEIIKEDIAVCKKLGADGVVFGILLPDGNIDLDRTKTLVDMANPLNITFHRAFDMTPDPFRALEEIIGLGIHRILTAGQQNTVPEGIDLIKKLVENAKGRIIIMPGSGINEANIRQIRDSTGATEFHLTGRNPVESKMKFRKAGIFMGGFSQIPEYEISITDHQRIREIVKKLNSKQEYQNPRQSISH
ncbi:MAG: copper homeostasis protein CutC [Bacteroidales bacterium]|nr:copper homeostasis protein CutC [Bacteroidales bacterium]